jgi:glycerol-3-phosphate dehydrogenase
MPWLGQYLIGTTDERYDGPLDHIKADDSEKSTT